MSVMSFLESVLVGPKLANTDTSLTVTFFMTSGERVVTRGVSNLEIQKTNEGGVSSYKIEWLEGRKPAFFSLTLDHISAIVAERAFP